jgi:cyclopropane fatty-acyl-phospholipid synthase-like methyltransferase
MEKAIMKTIYEDGAYLANNPKWHEEGSLWKSKQITKMLNKHNIIPSSVCEVGCGAGEILNCLTNNFGDKVAFYGYDISPQAFEICSKKEKHNLHFFLNDLLDEEGMTFELVMAIDVFEHVEDYFGFLRKLKNKGAHKIFHIPLDLSVQMVLRSAPIMEARSSVGHIHYFTKETALATLKDTGYEVVDYFYTKHSLDLPNRGWKADLMNLPRRFFFALHRDLTVRILGGFSLLVLAK